MLKNFLYLLRKAFSVVIGIYFIARTFLPSGGFLVYPFGELLKDMNRGDGLPAHAFVAVVSFNLTHIALGALFVSHGFEKLRKARKPLLIATLVLLAVSAVCAVYLFGNTYSYQQ